MNKRIEYTVIGVAAFLFTLFHAFLTAIFMASNPKETFSFLFVLGVEYLAFIPLAAGMFFIVWLSHRRPEYFVKITLKNVFFHSSVMLILAVFHAIWQPWINSHFLGSSYSREVVMRDFMSFAIMRFLVYMIMVGIFAVLIKLREHRKVMIKASELRLELQKAELKEIELKMNPELIYPNLNFIKESASEKPVEASQMVILMAGLLRKLVDKGDGNKQKLFEEVLFFRQYTDLLRLKLQRVINVSVELNEEPPETMVPSITILIPLIDDLIFGSFKDQLEGFTRIIFYTERTVERELKICLRFEGCTAGEKLEEISVRESLVSRCKKVLDKFEKEDYRVEPFTGAGTLDIKLSLAETREKINGR